MQQVKSFVSELFVLSFLAHLQLFWDLEELAAGLSMET